MKIHIIGCTGSFAGTHAAASSYLLEHTDAENRTWRVLLDLGSGAFGPLQRVIDPALLDAVIISHLHPDHFLDITGLEVFWAYNCRLDLPVLPIHAPADLAERIRAIMDRDSDVPDGVCAAPFSHHAIEDGASWSIGPLAITARLVAHPVESYAFRVEADGEVFVYSGDSDECAALDEIARDCDLFLCEAGYIEGRDDRFTGVHLTGKRAGETATRAGVKSLALTHIPSWTDPAVPLAEAVAEYDGPTRLVEALDILEVVERPVPLAATA